MLLKTQIIQMLAWLQMIFSILLAMVISAGYATYPDPIRQFIEPLSASVISVSKVVEMTAETVASKEQLIQSTKQTLMTTRAAIQSFRTLAQSQAKQAPQLAKAIEAASVITFQLGGTLNYIADGIMFPVPTGIQFEGIKPILIMSHPLAANGKELKSEAQNIQAISKGLRYISTTIANEGQGVSTEFGQLSEQTLKLLEETEKTLDGLQKRELPTAVKEMRAAAEHLRVVSKKVSDAGNIGIWIFIIGLLVSGWCFLNSLGQLMLAKQISTRAGKGSDETR